MHKDEIIIYWSNEDQVFVAEVPELPGCMAHGALHPAGVSRATPDFNALRDKGLGIRG